MASGRSFSAAAAYMVVPEGTTINTSTTTENTVATPAADSTPGRQIPTNYVPGVLVRANTQGPAASAASPDGGGQYGPIVARGRSPRRQPLGSSGPSGSNRPSGGHAGQGRGPAASAASPGEYNFTQVNLLQRADMEVDYTENNYQVLLQQLNVAAVGADPALLDQAYQAILAAREETHLVSDQATVLGLSAICRSTPWRLKQRPPWLHQKSKLSGQRHKHMCPQSGQAPRLPKIILYTLLVHMQRRSIRERRPKLKPFAHMHPPPSIRWRRRWRQRTTNFWLYAWRWITFDAVTFGRW